MTEPRPPIRPRDDDWPETRDYHREQADEIARLCDALREAWNLIANARTAYVHRCSPLPDIDEAIAKINETLAAAQEDRRE